MLAAAALAFALFAGLAWDSLGYWHWGDEDEKIVAAWMIAEGGRLYDDIFAHHGPLNYALAHGVYTATGSLALAPYRATQWAVMLMTATALAASPLLRGWQQRLLAGSLFGVLVALLAPLWYGHTLLYHALGGAAVSIALSLLLLPAIFGIIPSHGAAVLGGAALAAALFAAYPLAVSVVLLLGATSMLLHASGRRWRDFRGTLIAVVAGFATFAALMLLWLWRHGDLIGYGVYHLWFNQAVYASFIDYSPGAALTQIEKLFQSPLGWVLQAIVLFTLMLGIELGAPNRLTLEGLDRARSAGAWHSLWLVGGCTAFLAGLLFLNPRGEEIFKNAALWIVGLGLLSLLVVWKPRGHSTSAAIGVLRWLGVFVAVVAPLYLAGIKDWSDVDESYVTRAYADDRRSALAKQIRLAQALVPPGEPILATVFLPQWYLLTKRLPSSGAYYYLPWQAAYNRSPVLGYKLDPCADLRAAPPKLIVWDRWKVWDRYDVADYAPCLVEIMQRDYVAITGTQFLLRKPVSHTDRVTVKQFGFELAPVESAE
jgi:hypothetical protein